MSHEDHVNHLRALLGCSDRTIERLLDLFALGAATSLLAIVVTLAGWHAGPGLLCGSMLLWFGAHVEAHRRNWLAQKAAAALWQIHLVGNRAECEYCAWAVVQLAATPPEVDLRQQGHLLAEELREKRETEAAAKRDTTRPSQPIRPSGPAHPARRSPLKRLLSAVAIW